MFLVPAQAFFVPDEIAFIPELTLLEMGVKGDLAMPSSFFGQLGTDSLGKVTFGTLILGIDIFDQMLVSSPAVSSKPATVGTSETVASDGAATASGVSTCEYDSSPLNKENAKVAKITR